MPETIAPTVTATRTYNGPHVPPPGAFLEGLCEPGEQVMGWYFQTSPDAEHNAGIDALGGPTPTRHYRVRPSALVVITTGGVLYFPTDRHGELAGDCNRVHAVYAPTPAPSTTTEA